MSKQTRLVIVHDVLGTLFSLEAPTKALQDNYPSIDPKFAELIIYDWYHAVQRDYTNLSMNGSYQPISAVFSHTLPRILSQAGLAHQDSSSSGKSIEGVSEINLYKKATHDIMGSLGGLTPRPKMVQAFNEIYRNKELLPKSIEQVHLWGATNGGTELARKLFGNSLGENGSEMSFSEGGLGKGVGVFSCDEIKVAKPCPEVYRAVKEKIGFGKDGNQVAWFVATHSWDTYAAKLAGFKTAWVANEEHYNCSGIYGKPDITGSDLEDVSRKILAWERQNDQ